MNLFHVNINKIFTKNHCIFIGENLVRRVALIYLFFFFIYLFYISPVLSSWILVSPSALCFDPTHHVFSEEFHCTFTG